MQILRRSILIMKKYWFIPEFLQKENRIVQTQLMEIANFLSAINVGDKILKKLFVAIRKYVQIASLKAEELENVFFVD